MVDVSSQNNRIVKEYRLLGKGKYRKNSGRVILEGCHLLREALNAGIDIEAVLYTDTFLAAPGNKEMLAQAGGAYKYLVSDSIFNSIAQTESPQGVGVIARIPSYTSEFLWKSDAPFLLVLDRIQDPGNLGTIIRTAAAAAVDGVLLLSGTSDPTNPKALRAGMGGIFYLPVIHESELPHWPKLFAQRGIRVIAADPQGDVPYNELEFSGPSALIVGNESRGVSGPLLEMADVRAFIPLQGEISSLNAAVAAALFIFERQRKTVILN